MSYFINDISYLNTDKNLTILQACESHDINIPRFCYHEKLSIAGNCRMCLIELEKSPKPIASCALNIGENMKIYTNTVLVKKAREGILEFLLINHPLDCPICDWGGECDLQDQTQVFGGDRGRFYEEKRSVSDKNCGPLIKTFMTRCIHCTRCVRFYTEIAGITTLGTTGRGARMEISSYVPEILDSEISGNLIDLCPVGALTSKPSAFTGRPWDYESFKTLDPLDALGSTLQIDVTGLSIMRVIPYINEFINEEWISDKCRFFFDGLTTQRIHKPFYKKDQKLLPVSWEFAMEKLFEVLKEHRFSRNLDLIGIFGPLVDFQTLIFFKFLFNTLGSNNIFYQKKLNLPDVDFRNNFFFNVDLNENNEYKTALFVGLNLRKESAVLNARLRTFLIKGDTFCASIGSNFSSNFSVKKLGNNLLILNKILTGNHWFSNILWNSKKNLILFGASFFMEKQALFLWNKFLFLQKKMQSISIQLDLFIINPFISLQNSIELGLNIKPFANLNKDKKIFYFLGVSQCNFDFFNSFDTNKDFLIFQSHHGNKLANLANLILPTPTFIEKNCAFLNLQGFFTKVNKIFFPFGDSRIDSEIFKYVGIRYNLFNINWKDEMGNYSYAEKLLYNSNKNFFSLFDKKKNCFTKIFIKNKTLKPFFMNFYMSDPISESSLTMSLCTSKFFFNKNNFIR